MAATAAEHIEIDEHDFIEDKAGRRFHYVPLPSSVFFPADCILCERFEKDDFTKGCKDEHCRLRFFHDGGYMLQPDDADKAASLWELRDLLNEILLGRDSE